MSQAFRPRPRDLRSAALRRGLVLATLLAATAAAPLGAQPTDTTRRSTAPLFTRRDLWAAGAFTAATFISIPLDRRAADRLQAPGSQSNRFMHHQATNARLIAQPGSIIIGGGLYAIGRLSGNKRMADLGLHGTEAIAVGLGTVTVLKTLAGRARPYVNLDDPGNFNFGRGLRQEDYRSFPSGHTVMAFSAAAAVTSETTHWWPKTRWLIGPAMYGGASVVGLSRMYNNKHWMSDVLVGAALGTFSGLKVVRYHHSHPGNRIDKWLLAASVTPNGVSLAVVP